MIVSSASCLTKLHHISEYTQCLVISSRARQSSLMWNSCQWIVCLVLCKTPRSSTAVNLYSSPSPNVSLLCHFQKQAVNCQLCKNILNKCLDQKYYSLLIIRSMLVNIMFIKTVSYIPRAKRDCQGVGGCGCKCRLTIITQYKSLFILKQTQLNKSLLSKSYSYKFHISVNVTFLIIN